MSPSLRALTPNEFATLGTFATQRRTGVLTIMFLDLEGFTRLTDRHGDQYALSMLEWFVGVVRSIVERDTHGRIIKGLGDGMLVVFAEPSVAVQRALEVQHAMNYHASQTPGSEPLVKVRIGLHVGQVSIETGVRPDIIGAHVNRAARVESIARGGQIFLTHAVYENARGFIQTIQLTGRPEPARINWIAHGEYKIRGIDEPQLIYEVLTDSGSGQPPVVGPNCEKVKATVITKPARTRMVLLVVALVIASAGIIAFSARQRTVSDQKRAAELVRDIVAAPDLTVAPALAAQRELLPDIAFAEGNAALEYFRIPLLRIPRGSAPSPDADARDLRDLDSVSRADYEKIAGLANWLLESKIHSRYMIMSNQLIAGKTLDALKPVVTLEVLSDYRRIGTALPEPVAKGLDALENGAVIAECQFYPQVVSWPRGLDDFTILRPQTVGLVHRAQIARAIILELNGDMENSQRALERLLRFNFHLASNVNTFDELYYLLRYRRIVLLALVDRAKRAGDDRRAAVWGQALVFEVENARRHEQLQTALFDEGYRRAFLGLQAAERIATETREPFWRIQAALCLGLTATDSGGWFDRGRARKFLQNLHKRPGLSSREAEFIRVSGQLRPGEFPPNLKFIQELL